MIFRDKITIFPCYSKVFRQIYAIVLHSANNLYVNLIHFIHILYALKLGIKQTKIVTFTQIMNDIFYISDIAEIFNFFFKFF